MPNCLIFDNYFYDNSSWHGDFQSDADKHDSGDTCLTDYQRFCEAINVKNIFGYRGGSSKYEGCLCIL